MCYCYSVLKLDEEAREFAMQILCLYVGWAQCMQQVLLSKETAPSGRGNECYKHSALLTPREVLNALVMAADVQVIGWEHWPFQQGVSMGDSVQQIE